MDFWILLGSAGAIATSAQLLPQIVKSLKTRQVRDLSIGMLFLFWMSALIWLIYAWHLNDKPIMIANSINLAGASILVFLKVTERKSRNENS